MTRQVYTIGYTGRTPGEIRQIVEARDAMLFDIRYSTNSRHSRWTQPYLQAVLQDRYVHVRDLGNVNYRSSGPIQILDYEAGRDQIERCDKPVVLMCACEKYQTCHRQVVAQMLRRDGFEVQEIESHVGQAGEVQQPLFDL
jgi:uncharacterized protein (DUF488 family)